MITFEEAFGIKFGEKVQGAGIRLELSKLNPNLKGRALTVDVFNEAMLPINSAGIGTDGVDFDTAGNFYRRFVEHFAWSVNARTRLWKLKRKAGGAYFPFFGFSDTIRQKAIPKAGRPLAPGETFYMTFTDEHGESATVKAVFEIPDSDSGRALIKRHHTNAIVFYHCSR